MPIQYIHYGASKFDASRFKPIENEPLGVKPRGGLWASAVDAEYGWRKWCEKQDFELQRLQESFLFALKENANVLYINSGSDLNKLPRNKMLKLTTRINLARVTLDFKKMLSTGIDAIHLNLSNDNRLYWALYGWDCDSILIMNKDVIIPEGLLC